MTVLKIKPEGIIKSGCMDYSLSESGTIVYKGDVSIKVGMWTTTKNLEGTLVLQPEALQSTTYKTLGEQTFDKLKINVIEVAGNQSTFRFTYDEDLTGKAQVTTTETLIQPNWVDGRFYALGMCLAARFQP